MRRDIPIEAVSIDGSFIEDLLPGYMTIKTSGRETLSSLLSTIKVGSADGETFMYSNYPARGITVEFFLRGNSLSDLREKLNKLNNILTAEERDFIFNDEEDKYFSGIPHLEANVSDSQNACQGKYVIYCAYPFKRSIDVYEAIPSEYQDNSAIFVIDYQGTYPAKPLLEVEFASAEAGGTSSDDGDCGYISFIDDAENIIQLGNPEAIDFTEYETAATHINKEFVNLTDFNIAGGTSFCEDEITGSLTSQVIQDQYYKQGEGQSLSYAKPTYGSSLLGGWHGPTLWKEITASRYFTISAVPKIARVDNSELGTFELIAYEVVNNEYTAIAGIQLVKDTAGTAGTVKYIVDGAVIFSESIDLSYNNPHFGYSGRTQLYKTQYYNKTKKKWQTSKIKGAKTRQVTNGYSYTSTNPNITITKDESSVSITVGNLGKKTFKTRNPKQANAILVHFGKYDGKPELNTCALQRLKLVASQTGVFRDIQNVFTAGDIVEADCYDATVTLRQAGTEEGMSAPQYGALGNDWEGFSLNKGQNIVTAVWSDWVDPQYKPSVKIRYNEVFI